MSENKNFVDRIMDDTIAAIVEKYGEVKPEWNEALDKLRKQYTIIYENKEKIDGFYLLTRESIEIEKNRHPLLMQMKRLLELNQKLIEPDRKIIKIKKEGKWQLIKKLLSRM